MSDALTDRLERLLLHPKAALASAALRSGQRRLVHYTSAESGLKIINGAEVWMRHTSVMNDFMEIEHGWQCLFAAWSSERGLQFQNWLGSLCPGFRDRVANSFDSVQPHLKNDTYLTAVSLHDDREDEYGRLSMWRAYGGANGVALVMNPTPFLSETDVLGAYSAPVMYEDVNSFGHSFGAWCDVLMAETAFLRGVDPNLLEFYLGYAFRLNLLCTKHPGFQEEQEWRVFHSPVLDGGEGKAVTRSFESVRGVPQPVVKIPLRGDIGVPGLAVKDLINRVIIGPTENSAPIYLAYIDALNRAGVDNPAGKITVSNIPLRH